MRFLITGTAGFIGFHLARRLMEAGHWVCGVDGMTPYYDVTLKQARHAVLERSNAFKAHLVMLEAQGIVVRCPSNQGLAEEAPFAYKDVGHVVSIVERAGLARRVARLVPLGVVKG